MLILLNPSKLKERAKASGIPLKAICARANVHPASFSRMARADGRGLVATMTRLNLALAEIERERRAAIAALPPIGVAQQDEVAA